MEEITNDCLQNLPKANPIQKKVPVPPRSIFPHYSLPSFKHSDQLIDLSPSFCTSDQKQQHVLTSSKLSDIFQQPLYQSTHRFNLQASNLKFACIKAFYSQSSLHPTPLRGSINEDKDQLQFQSRFESGNLAFAAKGEGQRQYHLLLHKDINSTKCTQWFFFRVKNKSVTGPVKFNILNFVKNYSSYQNGMKILVCNESGKYTWSRGCSNIAYLKNNLQLGKQKTYYTLSFSYNFQKQNDVTYFAHSAPYTFTMLDNFLLRITNNSQYGQIFKRRTLTESPGGNYVELLTITNFKKKNQNKRVIFITSRVHPGETPSSFVCQGIINYLLSASEEAQQLRDLFVFKIVPMLNPDGVINGNYRCSLSGYDLNRVWHYDNKMSSPEIYYTKKALLQQNDLFLYIDLHAHSKRKGVFMYGCQNKFSPYLTRHIPYLLYKQISFFNYYQCKFGMKKGREGTSRLHINNITNLAFSYTMEHSFCGPVKEKYHFNVKHYKQIGMGVCSTLRKYYCSHENLEVLKELQNNKQLLQVGNTDDNESSDDSSELDQPVQFKQTKELSILKRKQSTAFRSKLIELARESPSKSKIISPKKQIERKSLYDRIEQQSFITRKYPNRFKEPRESRSSLAIPEIVSLNFQKREEIMGEEVVLTSRFSELSKGISPDKAQPSLSSRLSNRYEELQLDEGENLTNLFLPSLTSASYKRYAKKRNYPKHLAQVGKSFLESRGILKEQIRSVSRRKQGLKQQALSFL